MARSENCLKCITNYFKVQLRSLGVAVAVEGQGQGQAGEWGEGREGGSGLVGIAENNLVGENQENFTLNIKMEKYEYENER